MSTELRYFYCLRMRMRYALLIIKICNGVSFSLLFTLEPIILKVYFFDKLFSLVM